MIRQLPGLLPQRIMARYPSLYRSSHRVLFSNAFIRRSPSHEPSDFASSSSFLSTSPSTQEENGTMGWARTEGMNSGEEALDGFDPLEAAAQEMHDLTYGIVAFLRRADPEANQNLFQKRSQKRMREPIQERYRRLLHQQYDRSVTRHNSFASAADYKKACQLYVGMCEKLLFLLREGSVLEYVMNNAGKCGRDRRCDGVHRYRKIQEKASWRTFPHRWYRHAPFEILKLRADVPMVAVQNARFFRDCGTISVLFSLLEPNHPYRSRLESQMFQLTSAIEQKKEGEDLHSSSTQANTNSPSN